MFSAILRFSALLKNAGLLRGPKEWVYWGDGRVWGDSVSRYGPVILLRDDVAGIESSCVSAHPQLTVVTAEPLLNFLL